MTDVSWSGCRPLTKVPTRLPRSEFCSMCVWRRARRICVSCLHSVCGRAMVKLVPGLVMMSLFPVLDLGLQGFGRNAGSMIEHQPAAEHGGPHQRRDAYDAQHAGQSQLLRRHLEAAG